MGIDAVQGKGALCFRPGEVRAMTIRIEAFIFTTDLPEGRILNPVLCCLRFPRLMHLQREDTTEEIIPQVPMVQSIDVFHRTQVGQIPLTWFTWDHVEQCRKGLLAKYTISTVALVQALSDQ